MIRIALDAMGGDHGLPTVIPAAIRALQSYPDLQLVLVGDIAQIQRELKRQGSSESDRLIIHHASEVVAMDELPSSALRNKKDSSMRVAIDLIKENKVEACVSAGNTGALMATSRFVLRMLPGVDRPAIVAILPSRKGDIHMLDLGANIECSAEQLFQFAVMGSVLASAVSGRDRPTVGLLNVGEEEIKGNQLVKDTAELLNNTPEINYYGFVEGNDIYNGTVDVVVCDGFVGNITLKASEGIAKLMALQIKNAFEENWFTKLCGLVSLIVLKRIKKKMDPARYNGASFIGLNGIVIKSHGSADARAFYYAIEEAIIEVKQNVPQLIREQVAQLLKQTPESE